MIVVVLLLLATTAQVLLSHASLHSQVTELYEDLRKRVSHFNMYVPESAPPTDYTSIHCQKFIIQVTFSFEILLEMHFSLLES